MYYNPYQPNPHTSRPVQATGPSYGFGQPSYAPYPGNFYTEPNKTIQPYQQRPDAVAAPIAPAPAAPAPNPAPAPATAAGGPVPWTDQPIARIFVRPQQYGAAASAEETLRMGTAFSELFRPFNPGGKN